MTQTGSMCVLVLPRTEADGRLTCDALASHGIESRLVRDVGELATGVEECAGCAVIPEEACAYVSAGLAHVLEEQPPWSDFPFIVIGPRVKLSFEDNAQIDRLGNVTVLDPPLRIRTLVRAVHAALRGRQRQYEALRAIDERDRFLATLAHELRNPLYAALLALEVAARKDPKRQIPVMRRQLRQLGRLVDDLLDVARVSAGKIELRKDEIDVGKMVRDVAATFEVRFQDADVKLQTTTERNLRVEGDRARLDQVLGNILTNAIKYTPRGGRVQLDARRSGGHAVVTISDNGIGIEPKLLPLIFEPFMQIEASLARADGGMGIGLSLVKTLVELHGGDVKADSPGPGQGASFEIRLPLTYAARAIVHERPPPVAPATPQKIVIVEDNADSRELMAEILSEQGHTVDSAADGEAGVAALLKAPYADVGIVDLGLPKLDGFELARRVRSARGRDPFLIALSGFGRPQDRKDALAAGFDVHLVKPVDVSEISRLLSSARRRADGTHAA
jgi:signal transduction histidine kinase/ActR/RegA family two-component response regulator